MAVVLRGACFVIELFKVGSVQFTRSVVEGLHCRNISIEAVLEKDKRMMWYS